MVPHKLKNFYRAHFRLVVLLVFLALTVLAWSNRFIEDDAFISLRYADNLVHGKGLVWNAGERVEGYTNFLWTIILSIPLYLNLDPVRFAFAIGLCLFELSLYLTYRLGRNLFQSGDLALLAVVFLGTNHSFSSYATSGMETQLQASLFLACVVVVIESLPSVISGESFPWATGTPEVVIGPPARGKSSASRLLLLGTLLSLAMLTRLDSLLMVLVVLGAALFDIFRRKQFAGRKSVPLIYLLSPLALILGAWLIWKFRFYGGVLPNTFYVRVASLNSLKRGVIYVYLFFQSYWLAPFPFLFLIFGWKLLKKNSAWFLLALLTLLWLLYVVAAGGDFMEFRFIVPVLPFIFIQVVGQVFVPLRWGAAGQSAYSGGSYVTTGVGGRGLGIVLILLVLAGSLHHAVTFTQPAMRHYDIESTKGLAALLTQDRTDWIGIGQVLGDSFAYDANVSIATTAGGAIPFYSRLKTVDILGLNDKWVARYGDIVISKPGHQRRATLEYLLSRKVNLIIGHPQMVPINSDFKDAPLHDYYFYVKITKNDSLPATARIIEIPINSQFKLRVLYLLENPLIEDAIKQKGWPTYRINLEERSSDFGTARPCIQAPSLPRSTHITQDACSPGVSIAQ